MKLWGISELRGNPDDAWQNAEPYRYATALDAMREGFERFVNPTVRAVYVQSQPEYLHDQIVMVRR